MLTGARGTESPDLPLGETDGEWIRECDAEEVPLVRTGDAR